MTAESRSIRPRPCHLPTRPEQSVYGRAHVLARRHPAGPARRAARAGRRAGEGLARGRDHPHVRAGRAVGVPGVPGGARLPGVLGQGVPAPDDRAHRRGTGRRGLGRGAPGERVGPAHGAARAGRAHPCGARQGARLRLLLPQRRHQARPGGARRPLGVGRRGAELAAAPPPGDIPAGDHDHRARRGHRSGHAVVLRPRPAAAHEGHARGAAASRQGGGRARRTPAQPHRAAADVPVVGERGGRGARGVPVVLPA